MLPYWILFGVAAIGAVQYQTDVYRRVQGGILLAVFAFFCALIIGLRYEVGGDWQHYLDIYRDTAATGVAGTQDVAYDLVSLLSARLGAGIWLVNLVCGAIFTIGLTVFARRQPNPWLCILVAIPYLVIVVAMGYTRQAVAIGLILFGLADVEKRFWRFVVCAVLAVAFHKSAIVVIPFVGLTKTRNRYLTASILAVTLAAAYYSFVQASTDKLITNYITEEYGSQGAGIRVAMNVPPAILFFLIRRRIVLSEFESGLWRNFSLAALVAVLALLVTSSSTAVDRLSLYLIPLQMFVFCRLPAGLGHRNRSRLALTLAAVAYSAVIQFVWLNYADNARYWVPYRFYPTAAEQGA